MTKEKIRKEYTDETKQDNSIWLSSSNGKIGHYAEWLENKRIEDNESINNYANSLTSICLENIRLRQKIDKLENKIIKLNEQIIKEL